MVEVMGHKEAIKLLGGHAAVAAALGVEKVNTVQHWSVRRIPAERWHAIESLAVQLGISGITAESLARSHPRRNRTSRKAEA